MKKYILKSILVLGWLMMMIPTLAMPGPVDPPGEGDPFPEDDPTPIDNYLLVLIFAALIIGAYWLYRKKWKTA